MGTHIRKRRLALGVLIAVIVFLVGARLALPYIIKDQVNTRLAELEEYDGYVDDIDIALWRGNYSLRNVRIDKSGPFEGQAPLLWAPEIALSLQWRALFDGRVVGEAEMFSPEITWTVSEDPAESDTESDEPWYLLLEDLVPFTVNEFKIHDGYLALRDTASDAEVDVFISELNVLLANLSNVKEVMADSYATARITGLFAGEAPLTINAELNPLAELPMFEIDLELETVELTELDSLLSAYAGVGAESGTFSVYAEFASADGLFEGYVKPILDNPEFTTPRDSDSLLRKFWAATVNLAATIFENQAEEQVASQIPFSGELENVSAGIFPAILSILENAFIAALGRELEGTVNLEDLGRRGQVEEP